MTAHKIATGEQWLAARLELLEASLRSAPGNTGVVVRRRSL